MKKTILFFSLFMMTTSLLFAQEMSVSGTVKDASGESLPGVSILIKGTNNGTSTDFDGNYTINATQGDVLVFSFLGFKTTEAPVTSNKLNVTFAEDTNQLDEVIITSMGISRAKKSLGYAVEQIKADEITKSGQNNVLTALRSKSAGVYIQSSSGSTGAGSNILIRGISSLDPGRSNRPLYIINGIEVSDNVDVANTITSSSNYGVGSNSVTQGAIGNRMMDINPDDIESISILKGASATALYGLRATNGVIIIKTKDAKEGMPAVSFSSSAGWEQVNRFPKVQLDYVDGNRGTSLPRSNIWDNWGAPVYESNPIQTNNVYEDFYQTGDSHSLNANISGTGDKYSYYFSGGYFKQNGVVPNSDYKKINFNMRSKYQATDKLGIEGNLMYTNSGGNKPHEGRKSPMNVLAYMANVVDASSHIDNYTLGSNFAAGWIDHPLFLANNVTNIDKVNRMITSLKFNYDINNSLSLNYNLGLDAYTDNRERIVHPETDEGISGVDGSPYGFITLNSFNNQSLTSNLFLKWKGNLTDAISLSTVVGQYLFGYDNKHNAIIGKQFNFEGFYNLNNTLDLEQVNRFSRYRNAAVYAEANFGLKNFLFLTLTGRNDWSSTLPKDNRSFFFPSASLSWVISDMVELPEALNLIKLRGSYAVVGKDAQPYRLGRYYAVSSGFPISEIGASGYAASTLIGDENLKPEFTNSFEIGGDFKFFNNRLGINTSYYSSVHKDMILSVPVSNTSGASRYVTNAGEMTNKGLELVLFGQPIKTTNFNWDISLNWSKNEGVITSIKEELGEEIAIADLRGVAYKYVVGGKIGDLYGNQFKRAPDGQLLIGSNGLPSVDWDEKVLLGNALPDWVAGLSNSFSYKNIGLSFHWEWKQGGKAIDLTRNYSIGNGQLEETAIHRNEQVVFNGVVQNGVDANNDPIYVTNDKPVELTGAGFYRNWTAYRFAPEVYLQDASWIRLRDVSVSYTLPKKHLKNTGVEGVSISVTGTNLFLNTPFRGWDPEPNYYGANSSIYGYTGFKTPATKSFLVKFNIKL